jgi:hypothetical protein
VGGTGDRRAWAAVLALVGAVLSMSVPAAQTDGRLMFVGTYTAGTASKGIYAFRFDDRTGGLTPLCVAAETPNPSFLATRGDFVFAVNETSTFNGAASGSVTSFSADRATGRLTQLSVQPSRGTWRFTALESFWRWRTTPAVRSRCYL